jgi:hypothetical protein
MTDYLVVCAWCGEVMRTVGKPPKQDPPVSHGMCEACNLKDTEECNDESASANAQPQRLGSTGS